MVVTSDRLCMDGFVMVMVIGKRWRERWRDKKGFQFVFWVGFAGGYRLPNDLEIVLPLPMIPHQ